jgi:hypothetical protein
VVGTGVRLLVRADVIMGREPVPLVLGGESIGSGCAVRKSALSEER